MRHQARAILWRALQRQPYQLARLAGWSIAEVVPAFVLGHAIARAIDDGFTAARPVIGLAWLALLGSAWLLAAVGARQVVLAIAAIVEPFRDQLLTSVVDGTLHRSGVSGQRPDTAAVARMNLQVELVRDAFAAVIMVVRSFVFTVVSVVLGMMTLIPEVLLLVLPPFAVGLGLFLSSLPALARRQRAFILADERTVESVTAMVGGLRDIAACGAEDRIGHTVDRQVTDQANTGRALARVTAVRTVSLAVGGWLPILLVLAGTPWLLRNGATAGIILGALAYVMQSLTPALGSLVYGLGTSAVRLMVTLDRILEPDRVATFKLRQRRQPLLVHGHYELAADVNRQAAVARVGRHRRRPRHAQPSFESSGQVVKPGMNHSAVAAGLGHPPTELLLPDLDAVPVPPQCTHHGQPNGSAPDDSSLHQHILTGRSPKFSTPLQADSSVIPQVMRSPSGARLKLHNVTFAYGPHAEPVIAGLDLVIPEGDHLVVVGPSGIGKSTLAALITGMLEPDEGKILIGGVQAVHLDRAARVLIPQEAYVFRGSLLENLTYLADAPQIAVDEAVAAVGMADLVRQLGGYSAEVDPITLSAGQRQLIALTRAYLTPARLMVLDEATCHLDPAAEAHVETAFARRGGTLIVVAHRLTSARRARRVLVMDGTRILLGTHEELVSTDPLYADLAGHWQPVLAP